MKRRLFRLIAVVASISVGVGVFEWYLRARDVSFALPPSWRFHPVLGWTQPVNLSFSYRTHEGQVDVSFNGRGFHDVDHPLAKPAGVRRLVVIGDSYTEALQVNLKDVWWKRLEGMLSRDGGRWEAINLGVGDFGTAQEWLALDRYGLDYQPDLVVLQVFALNDLCNNSIELYDLCKSPNDRFRPYFVDEKGELRLTSAQPVRNALRHLRTWAMLEHVVGRLGEPRADFADETYQALWAEKFEVEPKNPFMQSFAPPDGQAAVTRRAWRLTERIVQKIVDRCRERGVPLVVLVAPFEQSVVPEEWHNATLERTYAERRLRDFLAPQGVPVAATLDAFARERAAVLPFIDGHPGSAGHRIMAEAVYAELAARGWAK